jgi:SDR family mycofactocin-dependent oxidoreductase
MNAVSEKTGKVDGRVAIITGGARGQGRAHAVALAREGADIVVADVPAPVGTIAYPTATAEDLAETVGLVEELGQRCLGVETDVRDPGQVGDLVQAAVSEFGRVDILVANHGVCSYSELKDMSDEVWEDVIDVNLTGSFNVARAVVPLMRERRYGRIVFVASGLARQGMQSCGHYVASKWGILGLTKSLALELATEGITVNAVLPTTVNTAMIRNDAFYRLFRPDLENPTVDDVTPILNQLNPQGIPWVEPEAVSYGVLFLVADEAQFMTGGGLDVGAGWNARQSA